MTVEPTRPDDEDGAPAPTTVEEVVRTELLKALGGWRGTLEAAVPILLFVVSWALTDELRTSIVVAAGGLGVFVLLRLLQRQTLVHVLSGVMGLVIAAVVATRTGNASDFFLPGILYNAALAVVFGVSMVTGWPVVGFLFGAVTGDATGWRRRRGVRLLFQKLTGVLLANYVIRVVVQLPLYLAGSVVVLGASKIVLGWPLLGVSVLIIGGLLAAGRTPITDEDEVLSQDEQPA
ncbi:DUF3159 domain-containing protein [Aquipuribacter sp. MA13-6]|uniref:DUF3159 domain-containing protein n=1 Tax=unclassified Aquipuribacter TaxID=2635084 RepID=UPI003EE83345